MHPTVVQSAYFRAVADLVTALGNGHVLLRHLDFHADFSGAFQLEFSRGHGRVRATWDGRESLLVLEAARVQNQGQHAHWQVVEEHRREDLASAIADLEAHVLRLLP